MIARYSRPEMASIWTDQNRYQVWLEVELAVCEELAKQGWIPPNDWRNLQKRTKELLKEGGVDPKRVDAIEKVTRHDVIAFTTAVAEKIGSVSRYIHFGLTSSDVVDTSLSILIERGGEILIQDIDNLLKVLKTQAHRHERLATIGRSHGIAAEPTSFGLKFLGWFTEMKRSRARLMDALEDCRYGKLSGAVGVNAHWDPGFEKRVLSRLGLKRELVSTQVIPRDRHAHLMNVMAICGGAIERISIELRHLQRSEVGEVLEGFSRGQKGSSAMPHKRNPISSENLTGCARLLRAYAQASLENIALWHERDISHSSVERISIPDAMILLDYALHRITGLLEGLEVRGDRVAANLERPGKTIFSGHFLLALVQAGVSREEGYRWVQECALKSLEGAGDFIELLEKHPEIKKHLEPKKVRELGSVRHQLRNVSRIYSEVFSSKS